MKNNAQKFYRLSAQNFTSEYITDPIQNLNSIFVLLATGPPPAAHARPSGLKRHSRGEDAFKEGRCIQGGNEAFKRN